MRSQAKFWMDKKCLKSPTVTSAEPGAKTGVYVAQSCLTL